MPFIHIYDDDDFDEDGEEIEATADKYSYEKPYLGDESGSASVLQDPTTDVTGRSVSSYLRLSDDNKETLKTFMPALKAAGVRHCVVTYDGGSDEGFGKLARCEAEDGGEITQAALLADVQFVAALEPFVAARFAAKRHPIYTGNKTPGITSMISDYLAHELPVLLVSRLIGRGYGTGDYELYGRAFVDLDTMTITDDPKAPFHGASD